jgi:hypothetical protein
MPASGDALKTLSSTHKKISHFLVFVGEKRKLKKSTKTRFATLTESRKIATFVPGKINK